MVNGDALREKLEASGVPGAISVWADVLHEGPVPGTLPPAQRRALRARFIAEAADAPPAAVGADLACWDAGLTAFTGHDEVVLWFEHDLFDQLALLHHLDRYADLDLGGRPLSLVCIGDHPSVERFLGLGQLAPEALPPLYQARQPVGAVQLALGRAGWTAFTGEDPTALERLAAAGSAPLPFLAAALRRLLEEYPATGSGLPRTERQVLAMLGEGPCPRLALFRGMQEVEESPFLGDLWFWRRLDLLAAPHRPLVEQRGDQLALTAAGAEVLAGRADWIDDRWERWIGGVHLRGPRCWRRDESGRLRLV